MANGDKFFRFDEVTVDRENFRVTRAGSNVNLTPRAFDTLAALLEKAGRLVEKQEIFDLVWKDTFVTDNALVKVIKEIRHALGDDVEQPHLIETVPKRGYRFIGRLEDMPAKPEAYVPVFPAVEPPAAEESGEHALPNPHIGGLSRLGKLWPAAVALILIAVVGGWFWFGRADHGGVRTIAVLPFKPLSDDSRDESLEMGMAETLINRLSSLKNLAVRPITAVRKYTDPSQDPVSAGQQVQVESVLDGNIQRSGERVRVTVRLVDTSTSALLWSETFDENFTDIFQVQDSIAEKVTKALSIELSRQERARLIKRETENPEAYRQYLQCELMAQTRRTEARECYQNVLNFDPNYALAFVGLAETYLRESGRQQASHQQASDTAKEYIAKALAIDESLAEAHNTLGEIAYQYDHDWERAEAEFRKALELNPNVAETRLSIGWFLMSQGRFDEAAVEMDRAKELDPSSMRNEVARGRLYFFSRQYEKARLTFENLITVEPDDPGLRIALFDVLEQEGKIPEAMEQFFLVDKLYKLDVDQERATFQARGWDGFWRERFETLKAAAERGETVQTAFAIRCAVGIGTKDEAFFWIEKGIEEKSPGVIQLKVDPRLDGLRDDPRYLELLKRIGLNL